MDVEIADTEVSAIAGAIAEPARTRMLYCLMDGHARTSTELAVVAGVSPSTASVHLARLLERLSDGLKAEDADRYLIRDAQRVIESIESLVRMHNAQEEDIYEHATTG